MYAQASDSTSANNTLNSDTIVNPTLLRCTI